MIGVDEVQDARIANIPYEEYKELIQKATLLDTIAKLSDSYTVSADDFRRIVEELTKKEDEEDG